MRRMSVDLRLSLLSAGGLALGLTLISPVCLAGESTIYIKPKATNATTDQSKITGNYEQLVEIQHEAVNQAVIRAKAATDEIKKIRTAIKQYEAQAELKKQQEAPPPEAPAEPGPLRSLEEPEESSEQTP